MKIEENVLDFVSTAFINSVEISPNGEHILYSYKTPSEDHSRYIEKIHLFNTRNSIEDSFEGGEESASIPKWSPSGKLFSIIHKDNLIIFKENFSQSIKKIYIEGNIVDYQWGKDDDCLWVLSQEDNLSEPGTPIQVGNFNFPSNIFYINLKTDVKTKIASEKEGKITNICSAQEGNKLYYTLKENDIYDYATRIKEFDYDQQTLKQIGTDMQFSIIKIAGIYENNKLVFLGYDDYPPSHCMAKRYYYLDCNSGTIELLMIPIAERGNTIEAQIFNSGEDILIKEYASTNSLIYALERKVIENTLTIKKCISHISLSDNGKIAFVSQDFNEAPNVYFTDIENIKNDSTYIKVSSINDISQQLESKVIHWQSPDGKDIEGILVSPSNQSQDVKQYPLVVIAAGRSSCFTRAFLGCSILAGDHEKYPYPVALLAKKGYFVLLANCRSTHYNSFEDLQNRTNEVLDGYCTNVIKGMEKVVEENSLIDSSRIGIMGWSLGGYIAARIASKPNNKIKVLVIGNAITDLISMYSSSNCYEFKAFMRGGFWESEDMLRKYLETSPIKYVDNIKAATLIQHGCKDPSMPVSQGREFYYALRLSNKEVRMTKYPNLAHIIDIPQDLVFTSQEVLDWIEEKL